MKTPPWKLIVPTVCFDLCTYKKSDTDPTLYRLHYSELLESFMDYTHIFTDGSNDGDKTAAAFICQSFEFSKRLPDKASIFTAELEAIVSALRYIKITTKNNTFVVFGDSKSALQALLSKWDHPTVQTIMRFLVFLHTVHKTVIFCWLPSHMGISGNERADSAAKAALQKDVSNCLISYTDTYQYISQYVRDMWQCGWDTAVNNKLHATKPLIGEQPSAYRSVSTTPHPDPSPALPSPSHPHTLTAHTHATQTTVMYHIHRNNRMHNRGYYDNLTNRPRTTTGLLTPHKHTGPAVKVREISSYCKST